MTEAFEISFRPLSDDDLPRLHTWLNDSAVVRWWEGRDVTWEAVVRDYGSGRVTLVEHWLALLNDAPLGWIQCYCAKDAEEGEAYHWTDHLDLERTGGIDYFVGDETHRGRGVGSAMIRAFVKEVVFAQHPEWDFAAAGPFAANIPSWKALQKAGFQRRATLEDGEGTCVLMVTERPT
jgi:aminoglycoside 6'-N-acetyltransferase